MGTPDFAVPSLKMLINEGYDIAAVVTQPDKPAGRGNRLTPPPVKVYALEKGIGVMQPPKVKNKEFADELKAAGAELFITAAYGRMLPGEILYIPRYGCINVHASLLPKYRGAAPINWAIINGEEKTGITTMFTDKGMDTGDMLLKREIEIPYSINAGELHDRLAILGAQVLKDTLIKLVNGTLVRTPQPEEEATYAPMMNRDMGTIIWDRTSIQIHNLVRGTNPWPSAFTFYMGERMKIWETEAVQNDYLPAVQHAMPGTVCKAGKDGLLIKAGEGYVKVIEIQFSSSRRMNIKECWHNFNEGEVLG